MGIRIATYNVEWFDDHFNADNSMKTSAESDQKFKAVKHVLNLIKADLITIIEAPNTTTTTGVQSTVKKLENFAQWAGLATNKAMIGFPSGGRQEIAVLYNPGKMTVTHDPGGNSGSRSNPPFDGEFFFDTDDDRIKEVYQHYRPPLEARIGLSNGEVFYVMGVHTKSKGIFNSMDQVHLERESRRNRLKLYAECAWIRNRVEDWLGDNKKFAVMGDMNDGPGMDLYEMRYGHSAAEVIMGDLFDPNRILRNYIGRPKWTSYGWEPSSARFKDQTTETYVNVLIDHIFASPNMPTSGQPPVKVWNPYKHDDLKDHRTQFTNASDHFPVTLDLNL
jgi:endonuclease/exonuclease/phosphatase family metal-dependent hydrolase